MIKKSSQSGFTAVELLITLFVAAAFLIAGYQLFNVVIKDGGQARAESTAGNIAYDYMRRYAPQATNPCSAATLLSNSAITVDGLSNATITVTISCPTGYGVASLSKVEATITYNTPQKTSKYSTFTNGISGTGPLDVTDGLIGWWKLNGNTAPTVGSNTGTIVGGATLTTGQNGSPNGAYLFNGSGQYIDVGNPTNIPTGASPFTLCAWGMTNSIAAGWRWIATYGTGTTYNGAIIGMNGTSLLGGFYGGEQTTASYWATGVWHNICLTYDGTNARVYANGTLRTTIAQPGNVIRDKLWIGRQINGAVEAWNGAVDDVRIYNRTLSGDEITTLYTGGAK